MLPIRVIVFGIQGLSGPGIYSGAGAPAAETGRDGGFYIDTTVWQIYGPKINGEWGAPTDIQGPKGDTGDDAQVTTANIIAAFTANPPSNPQKQSLAIAFGYQLFATRDLANAALGSGAPYFNTTTNTYDVATE